MLGWLALAAALAADDPARRATPVVAVTDGELDDLFALAHLAVSPRVDLLGVVTTQTAGRDDTAARLAADDLRAFFRTLPEAERPAVVAGSGKALPVEGRPAATPAADAILAWSKRGTADRRVVVVLLGAATDVATALATDPTLTDRAELVAMAFERWPEGGDPWNVKNDPRAWRALLDAPWPVTVGDEAVGERDLVLSSAEVRDRFKPLGATGRVLSDRFDAWLGGHADRAEEKTGRRDRWPVWDEVTVAALLGLAGLDTHPRPSLGDDLRFVHRGGDRTIRWVRSVRSADAWDDLARGLKASR